MKKEFSVKKCIFIMLAMLLLLFTVICIMISNYTKPAYNHFYVGQVVTTNKLYQETLQTETVLKGEIIEINGTPPDFITFRDELTKEIVRLNPNYLMNVPIGYLAVTNNQYILDYPEREPLYGVVVKHHDVYSEIKTFDYSGPDSYLDIAYRCMYKTVPTKYLTTLYSGDIVKTNALYSEAFFDSKVYTYEVIESVYDSQMIDLKNLETGEKTCHNIAYLTKIS